MAKKPQSSTPKLTPEFCELEYNNSVRVADFFDVQARWPIDAALARRTQSGQFNLHYGDDAAETLDFFPARRAGAPLFVFMHGGYWRALSKSDFSWIAPALVAQGAAVAIVDYGLAPANPIEEIVRQMLRAHAWLYRNADKLDFNRDHIVTSGHSAGGHLTAMMMAARWQQWAPDLPADLIKGGLGISGLYDLEPIAMAPFLSNLGLDPERVALLSPAYFDSGSTTPLITAVGGNESDEFKRQNALIATRWPGNFVRDVPLPGLTHMSVCDGFAEPGSPLLQAARELLKL